MIRTKNGLLKGLAVTLSSVLPAVLLAGCSVDSADPAPEQVSESAADLGVAVASCSTSASSGYNAMTSNLAIAMTTPSVVIGVVGGYITVNGYACVKGVAAGGAQLTPSMVKKITITGTSANNEKVVVDNLSGSFGPSVLATTGGIVVDLGSGTGDSFSLRGTSGVDKYTAGKSGSDNYFEISGDTVADIRVIAADSLAVSLSAGADVFSARGGTFTATHLAGSTVTTLAAMTDDITVNGGDGDDTITGGDGDDTLTGGNGNDLFKTAAVADGADHYTGGAGTDKMDYSTRSANLTVVMDGATNSGAGVAGAEADIIDTDVEDLTGGGGNDVLSGNASPNNIKGGLGDDTLWGGPAGTCLTDIDNLDGEAGNDTFAMTATSDCGDNLTGGAGTDIADYQLRTNILNISLDNGANDGESAEKDNVKSDIEVVLGGTAADVLTGSSANDELHGGPGADVISGGAGDDKLIGDSGNDTLNGEAGNDTFDDGDLDNYFASGTELKGAGGDIMNGGTGTDTVTYTERTNAVTVTICMDSAKLTGNTTLTAANCTDGDGESSEGDKIVNITHVIGGAGADTITGSTGDDTLEGGGANDTLHGGAGSDTLFGDANDDNLYGDAGDDYLDGGAGDDMLNGDTTTGASANIADGDICISDTSDTTTPAANCDL
jgi:Ca2+-binding RTX toxin-like protein